MPETQDTKNTTDQGRSGGMQTNQSNRPGQGASPATNPNAPGEGVEPGYGKDTGMMGAAERPAAEPGPTSDRHEDEMQKRNLARDSKHPGNPAEEWSPGTNQPNT